MLPLVQGFCFRDEKEEKEKGERRGAPVSRSMPSSRLKRRTRLFPVFRSTSSPKAKKRMHIIIVVVVVIDCVHKRELPEWKQLEIKSQGRKKKFQANLFFL